MTDKKISALPAASVLDGTELVPVVQGGVTKKTTAGEMPRTTASLSPSVLDADVAARTLAALGPLVFEPTAQRSIDVPGTGGTAWDLTKCAVLRIYKDTRAPFGIVLDVSNDPTWTTPSGLGQKHWLQQSVEPMPRAWDVIIDGPSKTVRVIDIATGFPTIMCPAPTASPGDTLDLFAGGTYTGGNQGSYQTGAPTSDGSAFIANAVTNTRRLEDLGDGNGQRLLMEPARQQWCLHTEDLYTGAVITAPWVAIGGTTGLGQQAGSPRGDATVTNLIFTASAADGIKQPMVTPPTNLPVTISVWARVAAATGKCRLQIIRKDGTTVTSADFNLTTTWQRIKLSYPQNGLAGDVGQPELRILNGTDAAARTIQVWGAQYESAMGASSYIKTTGASVTRVVDTLVYPSASIPANFSRGVKLDWMPKASSDDLWRVASISSTFQALLDFATVQIAGSVANGYNGLALECFRGSSGPLSNKVRLTASACGVNGDWNATVFASIASGQQSQASPPFSFNANTLLTFTWEAYRGVLRVEGAIEGEFRTPYGPGPVTIPTDGQLAIGGFVGGGATLLCNTVGSYGRFLTAA